MLRLVRATTSAIALIALLHTAGAAGDRDVETFHRTLLDALTAHNTRQVAALFRYPLRIFAPGVAQPIALDNAASTLRMYDVMFNPVMRCAIEDGKRLEADGVLTLADGRVIAQRTPQGFKITRMTLLLGSKPPANPPQHVAFAARWGEIQRAGRLAFDDVDVYVVNARDGNTLRAAIEGFPGRALLLRVRDQRGELVKGAATEFARVWSAPLQDGTYRVEVARNGGYCKADVTYVLTLGIR